MDDDLLGSSENRQDVGPQSSSIVARLQALRKGAGSAEVPAAAAPLATIDSNQPRQTTAEEGTVARAKPTGSLTALAADLFGDERFKAACGKGLHARLQRTRDGATAESRISELAGMYCACDCRHGHMTMSSDIRNACAALVKLLRRSLTQLLAKNEEFVRRSLQFEQLNSEQVRDHLAARTGQSV